MGEASTGDTTATTTTTTALEDGTYVILNAANTALALDSCGGTDGNNANVQLWTRNDTDAQLVRVWTRADGTRRLCFAGTGKCVDVTGNKVAVGANVAQYDSNDSDAQKWTVSPVDGETVTVNGTSYQLYKVYLTETGTQYLMEYLGTGTPVSGGNVCISTDEATSADQKWAFVPMNPVPTGTYAIRPRVNMGCALDVQGSSHAVGARVIISGEHLGSGIDHGNNQVVWLDEYDADGRAKLMWCHSDLLMEIFETNAAHSGTAVCQCDDYGGTDQQWVLAPHGSTTWNGVDVPLYTMRNYAASGTTLMADVCGGTSTPGTYLQIWPKNDTAAQDFFFQPAEMVGEDIPVPSIIGLADAAGIGEANKYGLRKKANDPGKETTGWVPGWRGDGTTWQARERHRTQAPDGMMGDWSTWQSVADGSQANDGWGTAWRPNVTTDDVPRKAGPQFELPAIDGTTRDRAEVQLEVRRFVKDYKGRTGLMAHGQSDVETIALYWEPNVSVTAAELGPHGIKLTYSSDYVHSGNTIAIASVTGADGRTLLASNAASLTSTGMPHSGTVLIPYSDLVDVPAEGEKLLIGIDVTTKDGDTAHRDVTANATYADGKTATITPKLVTTDRYTVVVDTNQHAEDEACLIQLGRNEPIRISDENGTVMPTEACPALGKPAKVMFVARDASAWNVTFADVASMQDGVYVWNWTDADGNSRAAILRYEFGDPITQQDSRKASYSELVTTGRSLPAYKFGKAKTRDLSVSGKLVKRGIAQHAWETEDDFSALLDAQHALFRTKWGTVHHVAVTGLDMPRTYEEYTTVSVSQNEETL